MTSLRSLTSIQVTVSGARGALGIDLQDEPTPGEFLVKAPGGGRTFQTATGTGADAGLRTDLAASTGLANNGFEQIGTGARTRDALDKARDALAALDYVATVDGSTDNSSDLANFRAQIDNRYAGFSASFDGTGNGDIPPGVYRVTASGILNGTSSTTIRTSPRISGSHQAATVIHIDGSDGNLKYAYNYSKGWGGMFQNMTIAGGMTWKTSGVPYSNLLPNVNGYNFVGPGAESAPKFFNHGFDWLSTCLFASGTNNADTGRISMCDSAKSGVRIQINNIQAFAWSFNQYYGTGDYDDFARWGSTANGGGGNLSVHQSAIIQLDDKGLDTYVFNMKLGAPGVSNAPVAIRDSRVELRGNTTHFAAILAANSNAFVQAQGVSFLHSGTVDKDFIQISGGHIAKISDSAFKENNTTGRFVTRLSGGTTRNGLNAQLIYEDSIVPETFWDTFIWEGTAGTVRASGLKSRIADTGTAPAAAANIVFLDADARISNSTDTVGRSFRVWDANMLRQDTALVGSAGPAGVSSEFPPLQVVSDFYVEVVPGYGAAVPYRLSVCSDPSNSASILSSVTVSSTLTGGLTVVNTKPWRTGAVGGLAMGYFSGGNMIITQMINGRVELGATFSAAGAASGKVNGFPGAVGFAGTYTTDTPQTVGSSSSPIQITFLSDVTKRILWAVADTGTWGASPSSGATFARIRARAKYTAEF